MPMRWGSSESSTTPMPSFLRASVSSCTRAESRVEPVKPTQLCSSWKTRLTFRMFCVSFHLLVHSLVSSRTCRQRQSHNTEVGVGGGAATRPQPASQSFPLDVRRALWLEMLDAAVRSTSRSWDSPWLRSGAVSPPYSEPWVNPGEQSDQTTNRKFSNKTQTSHSEPAAISNFLFTTTNINQFNTEEFGRMSCSALCCSGRFLLDFS